jgi:hypothetical protein
MCLISFLFRFRRNLLIRELVCLFVLVEELVGPIVLVGIKKLRTFSILVAAFGFFVCVKAIESTGMRVFFVLFTPSILLVDAKKSKEESTIFSTPHSTIC